jgi:hypothetical protein
MDPELSGNYENDVRKAASPVLTMHIFFTAVNGRTGVRLEKF